MKKALIIIGAVAGGALLARRFAHGCGHLDFEQMIERMHDDAPPKWMYRNISAIRANTERILELLPTEEHAPPTETHERAAAYKPLSSRRGRLQGRARLLVLSRGE